MISGCLAVQCYFNAVAEPHRLLYWQHLVVVDRQKGPAEWASRMGGRAECAIVQVRTRTRHVNHRLKLRCIESKTVDESKDLDGSWVLLGQSSLV